MLLAMIVALSLFPAPSVNRSSMSAKVAEAVDQNYLFADIDSWKSVRAKLLADETPTVSSVSRQLLTMHDDDLHIVTADQMAVMQAETAGRERGIGLVDFAVTAEPKTGMPQVVTPLVDSPAFRTGLEPGDVILSIDGKSTSGLLHEDVMALLRMGAGRSQLTVRRGRIRRALAISNSTWTEPAVLFRGTAGLQDAGYIAIHLFTPDSGERVRHAVASLAASGIHECILDLRNNPGGYLDAMATAGGAFTSEVLGWKVRRDGTKEPIQSPSPVVSKMRLAILVNEGTASAAEILAEGLRDTVGAKLVGSKTFGRGQIQTYVALKDGVGIVIPTASVQSAKGIRFNKRAGIRPDITVLAARNAKGDAEADAAYLAAIKVLADGTRR
jgi:carboxyl-terminal processing protease